MKSKVYLIMILLPVLCSYAQRPDFSGAVKQAMADVSVMVGEWSGEGWHLEPDGNKSISKVDENLVWKLDKTVILVEGIGRDADGKVVHNALGVISYDPFAKKYNMRSFLSSGLSTDAAFEVVKPNKEFRWWFKDKRGGTIRYSITLENGVWTEIGEYSKDGDNWGKFFEMNLKKQS